MDGKIKSLLDDYLLEIGNVIYHPTAAISGISLLFVLQGEIDIVIDEKLQRLGANQIAIVNHNSHFSISGESDNILIKLVINSRYFLRYFPNYYQFRYLIPFQSPDYYYKYLCSLRALIAKLTITQLRGSQESSQLEANSYLSEILLLLVVYFKEKEKKNTDSLNHSPYSRRIDNIIEFISKNSHRPLSLRQIAEQEHVSFAYLSRLFKKEVSINFTEYLSQLRLKNAMHTLSTTSKPIYQIAEECGFTRTRHLSDLFHRRYGKSALQLRQENRSSTYLDSQHTAVSACVAGSQYLERPLKHHQLLQLLTQTVNENSDRRLYHRIPIREQKLHLSGTKKTIKEPPNITLMVGEISQILKYSIQQQISLTHKEIGVAYVEVYHLISGDSILPEFISDEYKPSFSPYDNTDEAIAFLHRHKIGLILRLYMHKISCEPEQYLTKLSRFIQHNINMFGMRYLQSWRFICYPTDEKQRQNANISLIFQSVYEVIKKWLPKAEIGIFHSFHADKNELSNDPFFHSRMAKLVDFIGYAANPNEQINLAKLQEEIKHNHDEFIQRRTLLILAQLHRHNINASLYLASWNTLTGDTRHTNGRFFRGALLIRALLKLPPQVSTVGFWINSEIQHEALSATYIDIRSLALFYISNTRRPIYHVLRLNTRLRGNIMSQSEHYLLTQIENGYQLLLTNPVIFHPYLSMQEQIIQDLKIRLTFDFSGLKNGSYQVKKWIFDQQHGALYREFERQQTSYGRDDEIMQAIERQAMPYLCVNDIDIINSWSISDELDINAIHFYELKEILQ